MAHFNSLHTVARSDFESLLLTIAGWDQYDLRQRHLASKRLFFVDTMGDDRLSVALEVAAAASGYHHFAVPSGVLAKPSTLTTEIVPLADLLVAAAPAGVVSPLLQQSAVPVVWLRDGQSGAVDLLGHAYRDLVAGAGFQELHDRLHASPGRPAHAVPLDVRTLACSVAALLEFTGPR